MKRLIVVALVATGTLAGSALAQERTSARELRVGQVVASASDENGVRVARRCSGVSCLQLVPSLGVAF